MKEFVFFFTCVIIFQCESICQPIITDADNKQILEWDSSYTVNTIKFRANSEYEIPCQYVVFKNNKVAAEYFRNDDSSYLFVRYDTVHQIIQRGLIKLCSDIFAISKFTVQVPVWNADVGTSKELLKDTIIYDSLLSYRRTGIWKEIDSVGMIWKGKYINGLKEGEWKEGILLCCNETSANINDALYDSFRPYIDHIFRDGVEIPLYNSNDWQKIIKHKWFYNYYQLKGSGPILFLSTYKDDVEWHFLIKNRIEIIEPTDYSRKKFYKSNFAYTIIDDKLVIFKPKKKQVLQLVKFIDGELILKPLNNYINEDK